jgi:hypothetical protein
VKKEATNQATALTAMPRSNLIEEAIELRRW